ncbi:MAG: acyl-CoA dehydrogenase family protein [bacterium]
MTEKHASADEARALAEDARESEWTAPSFGAELFFGRFRPDLVFPYPEQDAEDRAIGDAYCAKLEKFLRENVDAAKIDAEETLPQHVIDGLIELGAFGMKIPEEYGGLGLSQINYNRAVALVASHCASTAVWLSAHQSIGVPQPLKMFGTEEQKKKYLPRLAKGAISGFALTEPGVGSDPANMATTAELSPDGTHWILNGEKLWCTNGLAADLLIVMARTPSEMKNGRERKKISAFLVEMNSEGIEKTHRCRFLGIRAIANGVLKFTNVKVPVENLLGGEGRGLKIALVTLNTGRLTLPAAATGGAKQALSIARRWANERAQWGRPIGKHEAVGERLAWMAAQTFAMESVSDLASGLAMKQGVDIRLEAAMAKLFTSVASVEITDAAFQIRGGRGYEREESLEGRGEIPYPMERMYRDVRINTIVEGTTDIMHLFIAREALDPHLGKAGALIDAKSTSAQKMQSFLQAATFYPGWYISRWLPLDGPLPSDVPGELSGHLRYVQRTSRRLARTMFHSMVTVGPKLEFRQALLARYVDIGVDLFAMSACVSRAASLVGHDGRDRSPVELADHFCRLARRRIAAAFRATRSNDDKSARGVSRGVLESRYDWLERGIVTSCEDAAGGKASSGGRTAGATAANPVGSA